MKKTLASLLAVLAFTLAIAQTGVPGQIITSFVQTRDFNPANPTADIFRPCMLYLPSGYQGVPPMFTQPPHLLVYIHGIGDIGPANGSNVNALRNMGPLKMLHTGAWDGTGMYTNECSPTKFMVFAVQTSDFYISHDELEYALRQLSERFLFSSIIFTGASAGGERTVTYALDLTRSFRPSHIIPMSVVMAGSSPNIPTVVQGGMKMWAFVPDEQGSTFYESTTALAGNFNAAQSGSALLTVEPQPNAPGSHCCWDVFYNPSFRRNDGTGQMLNIYEWACKQAQFITEDPPQVFACPSWIGLPKKFAGYVTSLKEDKIGACNANCVIPLYTDDGNVTQGSIIWPGIEPGHYGFSTIKEKNRPANKHLVIDSYGEVTLFESCVSPAGYVSSSSVQDMTATCSKSCTAQIYTYTGTVDASSHLYNSDGTDFNGGWVEFGYSTTPNGTSQKKLGIRPDGTIYNFENCGGGRIRTVETIPPSQETNNTIRIFPNPAGKQLYIQLGNSKETVQVQLYNMSGVLVYVARAINSMHVITTNNFAKGVYQLKLTNKQGTIKTEKIIIQ